MIYVKENNIALVTPSIIVPFLLRLIVWNKTRFD